MMLEFLETGKALYVLAGVCILGLLARMIARSLYKRLVKETDNMTLTKNRYLRDLKQKAENTYRLNQGINNSRVYLEKQLVSYRFLGMTLSGWTSFGGQMTILCFLLGGAASFGAYWYRCDSYYIVLYGSVGILTGLGTMVADYWANLPEQKQQLLNALQDYMDNSLFNRLVRETAAASAAEESRRDSKKASAAREDIRTLERRRGRTERAVQDLVNPEDSDEDSQKRKEKNFNEGLEDQDFMARDLEELSQSEYGRAAKGAGDKTERDISDRIKTRVNNSDRRERADDLGRGDQGKTGRRGRSQGTENDREQESRRRDVDYLKNSLEQIAASRERSRAEGDWVKDLSPDELEMVGQLLRQYLS